MNQSLPQSSDPCSPADVHASKILPPVKEPGSKTRTGSARLPQRMVMLMDAEAVLQAFARKQPMHAAVLQLASAGRLQTLNQEAIEVAQSAFLMFKAGFDARSEIMLTSTRSPLEER
jgi:hypothetical protein